MDNRIKLPSFCGISTFLRAPYVTLDEVQAGDYVVSGVPYDITIGTKPGARYAPNAIRDETRHFIYHLAAIDEEVIDTITGETMRCEMKPILKDIGDIQVYPTDVERTTESVASVISEITARGATPVSIGGDHYCTYPLFKGFDDGLRRRLGRQPKIGYIHIDSHMDMYDNPDLWGKYYQGSPARRVSEFDSVDMHNMVFVGIHGTTGKECYEYSIKGGATIFTTKDIAENGMRATMQRALEIASAGCDTVYVTFDIDAVDSAYAAGTGCVVFGGITAGEMIEAAQVVGASQMVGGIDVVEVSPPLDYNGITCRLGATCLIEYLKPRLFTIHSGN